MKIQTRDPENVRFQTLTCLFYANLFCANFFRKSGKPSCKCNLSMVLGGPYYWLLYSYHCMVTVFRAFETLDYTISIGSTPTFLYFDLKIKIFRLLHEQALNICIVGKPDNCCGYHPLSNNYWLSIPDPSSIQMTICNQYIVRYTCT